MINIFMVGGKVVQFSVNDKGFGELVIEVTPPKSDSYHVKIKLFKEQAATAGERLIPGAAVLVSGQIKGRTWEDKIFMDLNCSDYFVAARKSELPEAPPPPKPAVEEEPEELPF